MFRKFSEIENVRQKQIDWIVEQGLSGGVWNCSVKCHGCLEKTSRVMLANGEELPISEIEIGDIVLSFDGEKNDFVPAKVKNVIEKPIVDELDWYRLSLDNGRELVCTGDHKILTKNRDWVQAKDLEENDEIVGINDMK